MSEEYKRLLEEYGEEYIEDEIDEKQDKDNEIKKYDREEIYQLFLREMRMRYPNMSEDQISNRAIMSYTLYLTENIDESMIIESQENKIKDIKNKFIDITNEEIQSIFNI
jgi:hypothetical protein